jgi:light-regulated signal transduction histidine kinase (bacteriophytochrome)
LENLLGNAWKYTSKVRDAQITLRRDPAVPGLAFLVRDNGAGFDMRFADRLFGVFQRLHSASDFPGNGVGLASVQRIVRRHGGEIWAESAVGRGSTFRFTLAPAASAEPISEDPSNVSDSVWPRSDLPPMPSLAATEAGDGPERRAAARLRAAA